MSYDQQSAIYRFRVCNSINRKVILMQTKGDVLVVLFCAGNLGLSLQGQL